jgi:hypothetical protein
MKWARSNKLDALLAWEMKNFVLDQPGVGGSNGPENARQHLYIAAQLVLQFGEKGGREILNAHESIYTENGDLNLYAGWNDARKMDLINNEVGIAIGLEAQRKFGYATAEANAYKGHDRDTQRWCSVLAAGGCLPTCLRKGDTTNETDRHGCGSVRGSATGWL